MLVKEAEEKYRRILGVFAREYLSSGLTPKCVPEGGLQNHVPSAIHPQVSYVHLVMFLLSHQECHRIHTVQGPAWGGALLGPSPPAEGLLQGGMPSLRDIQAQQQQVRESCSRSFGAAGSSPGSAGRDGFSSYLQW